MKKNIAVLPGDGVGREVAGGATAVLKAVGERFGHEFEFEYANIGGAAIDESNNPLPNETLELCKQSDAVFLGAVGGPKWDNLPTHIRPERGLLAIRKELGLFANLRPVIGFNSLLQSSPLKPEIAENVNLMIVRELTGGLYFGKPSERRGENQEAVVDTLQYTRKEIERIVEKAFELAMIRNKKLTSVDKANVLESSRMWREIVNEKAELYPQVAVDHMYVDAAAMKLISNPRDFDVVVTENLFGDILSDEASMITGSLGMLPSASLTEDGFGLYEPVHGSAPDIAGLNKANPMAMILSAALMLKYSFQMREEAEAIEQAVQEVLNEGYRTVDLQATGNTVVGTDQMIDLVVQRVKEGSAISSIMGVYM
ncbi:3-isopropylmalate dehydrogenase [Bacillus sp. B190/17]|uniref:3-isopropylmalate dehydrogenase n=1 Tax=Bacillus lumedeiriae TaxID=3058829 RepID=A0ABW8I8S7_9BACI